MTPEERLATVEAEMREVRDDVREMRQSLKTLEAIAARGGGALHTALWIGGLLGWFIGVAVAIASVFKH